MTNSFPQVVTIAGSDSDGSAGAQADLHSFFARKVYGVSILVAAVSGNSYGITNQHLFPQDFIDEEFKVIAEDFEVRAAKTGMLGDAQTIKTVIKNLKQYDFGKLVVDPVIATKHGAKLLTDEAIELLKNELLPMGLVTTPNIFEAEILSEQEIQSDEDMLTAAKKIQSYGVKNVVIKGRHPQDSNQDTVIDFVLMENGDQFFLPEKYINTTHINGTGDTFSSIIVAEIAKGTDLVQAIKLAKTLTNQAIRYGIDVGHQYGPINHLELL
ncbi:MAG: bifunctional hydroxymethylpyrimidine kinase/phosphomethylpyrimidine kinase [Lactobacillaceae bacterium]|jgi:hydroxymethylpyrimidine/phosphomethylpyrimidine kinase|nr:bifunctional hydroxymethylpyrimidine kinase/phosphomethylpyrimidine kinase [Lactobacillaceae bacterium]